MAKIEFTIFPVLETERLRLRQLSIDDQHDIFALRSDKEINKYLERERSRTIEDAVIFINKINDNIKKNNSIYWVITLAETGSFVGTICLFNFSDDLRKCEIGYELLAKFQGQGIMKEASERVIDYAFQELQFEEIAASVHYENQASIKLLMKFGFVKFRDAIEENPDFIHFTLANISN